mmetsp:Transcript_10346/g.20374  ORF Transcript_10346/g.20374 Transcript_10346/m.20374 type:complete len:245 (-) Transcript_10346:1079-1813(-)
MVKAYESAYTYLPFIYLFGITSAYGCAYHASQLYRPYVLLCSAIINTVVHSVTKSKPFARTILHMHIWKTTTTAFYGILLNNVHDLVFHQHVLSTNSVNLGVSLLYWAVVIIVTYIHKSEVLLLNFHLLMLFVPLQHTWQISLYLYTLYVSASIFILFSRCSRNSLLDPSIYIRPVVRFFLYLRIADGLVPLGIVHIFIEYRSMRWEEIKAMYAVSRMLDEEIAKVEEHSLFDVPPPSVDHSDV